MFAEYVRMGFPSHLVDRLRTVETADDEILILGDLLHALSSCSDSTVQEGNLEQVVEEQESQSFHTHKTAHSKSVLHVDDYCTYADSLNYLVAYIFERRFGWSESDSSAATVSDGSHHRLSVVRRPTLGGNVNVSMSLADDLRCKNQINEALDKLIAWYLPLLSCHCMCCSFFKLNIGL